LIFNIKADDRGCLYGDAVFETMPVMDGFIPFFWQHMRRLAASAKALGIELDIERVKESIRECLVKKRGDFLIIRVGASRGRGYGPLDEFVVSEPTVIIREWKRDWKPLRILTSSIRRGVVEAIDPKVKCANFLPNVLSYIEARRNGADDALFLSNKGHVQEATTSNIFIVMDSTLLTPPLWVGVLPGITRDVIMRIAKKEGIPLKEEAFTRYHLYTCSEAFLTNSVRGVLGIKEVDRRGIPAPGPITEKLSSLYWEVAKKEGERLL
jgi:branched-chain amino acid aminotransferase